MGDIFLKLLNMSIAASWLILAVLLLRLILKKTPKWIHCLLWGFVAVRLICPFSIESAYSLIPSTETVQSNGKADGQIYQNIPAIDSRMPVISNVVNPVLRETFAYEEEESAAPFQVFTYAAGVVWFCGALLLLAYAFIGRLRLRNMVKEAVCQRDNIYLCDAVESPFIFGVLRPRIYLPSGMGTDMQGQYYVIAHEQAHLRRKDHWWKPFGYLLLAVYWFNPLCWIAYFLLCKDIEFACDEKVIRDMSLNEKQEYSKALLSCCIFKRKVMVCPLAFGEVSVKERIKSVLNYKKAPFLILLAGAAACIAVLVFFMTNPLDDFQIRVTIPSGSTEQFAYSDEEICPKGGTLTVYAGEGLGDTEIVLLPMDGKEENVFKPTYITGGMPVKFEVEKGAWYKIGVNVQNTTDEDRNVYVMVNNVDVRIADIAYGTENEGSGSGGQNPEGGNPIQENGGYGQGTGGSGQADGGYGQGNGGSGQADGVSGQGNEGSGLADGSLGQGNKGSDRTGGTEGGGVPYDMGDLDGNGVTEYLLIDNESGLADYDAHLSFYFNGESIYEYDDLLCVLGGKAEYIDLDSDGEPEIFFAFTPNVNSMPLIEYAVLKRTGTGWKALEMPRGETMLDNGFPISSRYGKEENTIVIGCEGTEKQIVYDFTAYYEARIKEYQEEGIDPKEYQEILDHYRRYEEGDDFGEIAAWGIWDIKSGTYEGKNCLIATHGLQGPVGKFDMLGEIDIYFNYDQEGLVNIINMEFREFLFD